MKVKKLPKTLLFGSETLNHHLHEDAELYADGIHRINQNCVELETYYNLRQGGSAGFIGLSILLSIAISTLGAYLIGTDSETLSAILISSPILPCFAVLFYFANGAHRNRGAFIRINRITRKLYYVPPNRPNQMHVIDWNTIQGVAGFVPFINGSGCTSHRPLYLIGVDYEMNPPTEICISCGNPGSNDGGQSARSLWTFVLHFMENGPKNLPEPAQCITGLSRRQAALEPFRDWAKNFKYELVKPHGWIWSPITIPIWLFILIFGAYANSVEEWIQYNVPYVTFPHHNDVLCGFAEKRKPVIRVNGVKLDH